MRETIAALGEETQEAIDSLRSIARGIYPPLLAAEGLPSALTAQARKAPFEVAIDEAVTFAKRYSTDEAGKLVNGILGKIQREETIAHER